MGMSMNEITYLLHLLFNFYVSSNFPTIHFYIAL